MINVLLIGCGNIGALYDLHHEQVLTYAKAFSLDSNYSVTIYDPNTALQHRIAARYGFKTIENPSTISYAPFDIVCIATPTVSHFPYLVKAIQANVPVICCEKPVTYSVEEAAQLVDLYKNGNSRILVNYIRRFQPKYETLRDEIRNLLNQGEAIQHIRISYKRGLLNNGSHVLDLVQFITSITISAEKHEVTNSVFDTFPQDPTLSGILQQESPTRSRADS